MTRRSGGSVASNASSNQVKDHAAFLARHTFVGRIRLQNKDAVEVADDGGDETLIGCGVYGFPEELSPVGPLKDAPEEQVGSCIDVSARPNSPRPCSAWR